MRIFDPDAENSGYNPYELIPANDEPKFTFKDVWKYIIELFTFACYIVGCMTIGWNFAKILLFLVGDVNVSFSPW